MSNIDRTRNDIFRVMNKDVYKSSKRDVRSREFILPGRVVWTNGHVENAETLLKEKSLQSSLLQNDVCMMKNEGGEKASILLDFGVELHGGIRVIALDEKNGTNGKGTKVRIRFGESVSEAMSEIGMESNATNDHA